MIDEITRHQIYLNRYAGGVFRSIVDDLKAMRNDIAIRIASASTDEMMRLTILMADLNVIIDGHFDSFSPNLFTKWDELAQYESLFALKLLDSSTVATAIIGAGMSAEQLRAFISNSAMRMAGEAPMTIDSAISTFNKRYKSDIKTAIQNGIVEGKTTQQIVREVERISNTRSKRQAEALIRTITNHVGQTARKSAFRGHSNLFEGEQYIATLDSRTTLVCASNDGKIFPEGVGPIPPLHWQCRSVRVPKIKNEYDLSLDNKRASVDGPVSAKMTYSGWLRKQPKSVQDEVLGKERADLFRSGKYTLDRFVDNTGKIYTLDELKTADALS